jgi:hypothetical protein
MSHRGSRLFAVARRLFAGGAACLAAPAAYLPGTAAGFAGTRRQFADFCRRVHIPVLWRGMAIFRTLPRRF